LYPADGSTLANTYSSAVPMVNGSKLTRKVSASPELEIHLGRQL
jgi:hypothetical protein